jgi:prefoldin subunit 5
MTTQESELQATKTRLDANLASLQEIQEQIKKLQEEGQKLTQPLLEDQAIVRTLEKIIAESEPKTD